MLSGKKQSGIVVADIGDAAIHRPDFEFLRLGIEYAPKLCPGGIAIEP